MAEKKKRRKKRLSELPDKELVKKLFPKKVVEEAERIAHEHDDPEDLGDSNDSTLSRN